MESKKKTTRGVRVADREMVGEKSLATLKDFILPDLKLNERQKLFCLHYVECQNSTLAAERAGYEYFTNAQGYRVNKGSALLSDPEIKRGISELSKAALGDIGLTEFKVMKQLVNIAFADPRKILDENDEPLLLAQIDDTTAAAIENIKISYNSKGDRVTEVKFASKTKALENIMKYLGAYAPEKLEISSAPNLVIDMIRDTLNDEKVVSEQ